MRRGGLITGVGCMAPFIAAGLWIGLQIDVPDGVLAGVNGVTGRTCLYPVLVDGKVGYIDRSGRLIVPAKYEPTGKIGIDAISQASPPIGMEYWQNRRVTWGRGFNEGRAALRTGRGWQMIDSRGRMLLDRPLDVLGELNHGLAGFAVGDKYGLVDQNGKVRVAARSKIMPVFRGGFWLVESGGYMGLLDDQGRQITGTINESLLWPTEGLIAVRRGGKWGFVDFTGREVIPCQFDRVTVFCRGQARALQGAKRLWIDKTGRCVARRKPARSFPPPVYDDGLTMTSKNNLYGLTDRRGLWFTPPIYRDIGRFDCTGIYYGRAPAPLKPKAKQPATPREVASILWGIIGDAMHANPRFGRADPKGPPRLAVVETIDKRFGIMDLKCRLRSQGFDGIYLHNYGLQFHEGRARVSKGRKIGFVDTTGRIVIEPQFDYAEDFRDGLSRFTMGVTRNNLSWICAGAGDYKNAKWGYVDRTGRIVWKPTR